MESDPIRVAVIGTGRHTRQILLPALLRSQGIRVVTLATAHPETAAAAQQELGFPAVVGAETVLARSDVEAVVVATSGASLSQLTAAALAAGKHVFCETPGIRTPEEAQAVGTALRQSDRVLAYGTCLRYAPIYQQLRALLPEVRTAEGVVLTLRYYEWLRHIYDLALYLLGDVAAVTSLRRAGQHVTLLEFAAGDLAMVHGGGPPNVAIPMELAEVSGPSGLLSARGARELWSYRGLPSVSSMDVAFDSAPATVWAPSASIPYASLTPLTLRGYVPELESFAQSVRTGAPTLSGLDQAERTLRLERAVARAEAEGSRVTVEPPFSLA